jgi:hypothetical protein
LARSRTGGRAPDPGSSAPPAPTLAAATLPRVWQGVGYRPLPDAERGRALFDFAAIAWPERVAFAWGAYRSGAGDERLIGAVAAERHTTAVMLHGPVVHTGAASPTVGREIVPPRGDSPTVGREIVPPRGDSPTVGREGAPTANPIDVAAQLVAAALDHATALGARTIYVRPQGLDRVWVRFGFIPVPEVALPPALAGRPGVGLYAWRGGSALWTLREAAEG